MNKDLVFLDCTLRDGGYYNNWDFDRDLIRSYVDGVVSVGVNLIELGYRSVKRDGFRGACAYTTDSFIDSLDIDAAVEFGVMVNASEIIVNGKLSHKVLCELFPRNTAQGLVSFVRIACHAQDIIRVLEASVWLKERGYKIVFNIMQASEVCGDDLANIAKEASMYPVDALYFADSYGSMRPQDIKRVIEILRTTWDGHLGIHAHDNMGYALSNTLEAISLGCTWVDATVTGIGRGAGNTKTELLALELADRKDLNLDLVPLMTMVSGPFRAIRKDFSWDEILYYYMGGKYSIHPTYIQEMISDKRYGVEDTLGVIAQLRIDGGDSFSSQRLGLARNFYSETPYGTWCPKSLCHGKEVLLLGSGSGVEKYRDAIESYISKYNPLVMALNTQSCIRQDLIDVRVACHPIRLLSDSKKLISFKQPLIVPVSMLPDKIKIALSSIELLDYGLAVEPGREELMYEDKYCVLPASLVASYALAVVSSGGGSNLLLAGFDGYDFGDPRQAEMNHVFYMHQGVEGAPHILSVTPTTFNIDSTSVYAILQ